MKKLDQRVSEETMMPVVVAENALDCVAIGTGQALENIHLFTSGVGITSTRFNRRK